jgi:hypothetical protein
MIGAMALHRAAASTKSIIGLGHRTATRPRRRTKVHFSILGQMRPEVISRLSDHLSAFLSVVRHHPEPFTAIV